MENTKTHQMVNGETKKLILPSGFYVVIREQNGNDDDILSNTALAKDGSNIDMFLSSLIIDTDLPFSNQGKVSLKSIPNILLRDKYFILLSSRVHTISNIVRFKFSWGKDNGGDATYNTDLNDFLWDYSKPFPKPGDEGYSEDLIKPYPENAYDEFLITLASGKELKLKLLNGFAEKYLLGLNKEEHTKNAEIKARGLEQKIDNKWVKVDNFRFFSKREMIELHSIIKNADPDFTGNTELENPLTGEKIQYPIIAAESFFYPEEI